MTGPGGHHEAMAAPSSSNWWLWVIFALTLPALVVLGVLLVALGLSAPAAVVVVVVGTAALAGLVLLVS